MIVVGKLRIMRSTFGPVFHVICNMLNYVATDTHLRVISVSLRTSEKKGNKPVSSNTKENL